MCKPISLEMKEKVREMLSYKSISEIAKETGLSERSVCTIQRQWGIERSPEQLKQIRSRVRKELVNKERMRVNWGADQKTNLKVVCNKQRHSLKYRLKRIGYKTGLIPNLFHYDENTKRNLEYEKAAKTLGLTITPA